MLDFLSQPIITFSDRVSFDVAILIGWLCCVGIAYIANQKQRRWQSWTVVSAVGFALTYMLVGVILPDIDLAEGEIPGKWQLLWQDPAFRSDMLLAVILLCVFYGLARFYDHVQRHSIQASPTNRVHLAGGLLLIAMPIFIWLTHGYDLVDSNNDRAGSLATLLVALSVPAIIVVFLNDWYQRGALLIFAVILLIAQSEYNSTIEEPESILDPQVNIPVFLPLLPFVFGWLAGNIINRNRHHMTTLVWRLGGFVWAIALAGFLTSYLGEYEFGGSYAFEVANVVKAPIPDTLNAIADQYYSVVPREIDARDNLQAAQDYNFVLQFGAGLLLMGILLAQLLKLPQRLPHEIDSISSSWRQLSLSQRRALLAFSLVTPALLLRAFTTLYPFVETLLLSVQRHNPAFPPRSYNGLRNFESVANNLIVRESLEFTLLFVFSSTFFQVFFGLLIAHLLNAEFRLRGFSRMISLIPWAIPMVVVGIASRWLFDDDFGMIPDIASRFFGYEGDWLIDPVVARTAVTSVNIWKSMPFVALILLAGLQGISDDLYEAARVDGANILQQFRFITIPMLMPLMVTISMFMLVWQLATFDLPFTMTGGGPGFATTVLAQKIYEDINTLNYSRAATLSVLLFAVVAVISVVGLTVTRRVEVKQ